MDRNIKLADHLYSDQLILYFFKELFINSVGSYWMNSNFIFSEFVNEIFAIQEVNLLLSGATSFFSSCL